MPDSFSSVSDSSLSRAASSPSSFCRLSAAVPDHSFRLALDQPRSFRADSTASLWLAWHTNRQYWAFRSADIFVSSDSSPAARAAPWAASKSVPVGRVPICTVTWGVDWASRGRSMAFQGSSWAFWANSLVCSLWMVFTRRKAPFTSSAPCRALSAWAWSNRSASSRLGLGDKNFSLAGAYFFRTDRAWSAWLCSSLAAFSRWVSGRLSCSRRRARLSDSSGGACPDWGWSSGRTAWSISTQPSRWSLRRISSRSSVMAISRT